METIQAKLDQLAKIIARESSYTFKGGKTFQTYIEGNKIIIKKL